MELLIDTHVFLWALRAPETLSPQARDALETRTNDIYLSTMAMLEIVIKYDKGKLDLPMPPAQFLPLRIRELGIDELDVSLPHVLAVSSLPPIHSDPFDRIMIAQAQVEGFTFVTRDAHSKNYKVKLLPA
jgi:PIN domain nuclease of toxin-antitoxin system